MSNSQWILRWKDWSGHQRSQTFASKAMAQRRFTGLVRSGIQPTVCLRVEWMGYPETVTVVAPREENGDG